MGFDADVIGKVSGIDGEDSVDLLVIFYPKLPDTVLTLMDFVL